VEGEVLFIFFLCGCFPLAMWARLANMTLGLGGNFVFNSDESSVF
jgi:hypothetical protein